MRDEIIHRGMMKSVSFWTANSQLIGKTKTASEKALPEPRTHFRKKTSESVFQNRAQASDRRLEQSTFDPPRYEHLFCSSWNWRKDALQLRVIDISNKKKNNNKSFVCVANEMR
jgi:hypothetical protein